jgi:hypothetical protein
MQAMDGAKAQAGRSDRRAITDEREGRERRNSGALSVSTG